METPTQNAPPVALDRLVQRLRDAASNYNAEDPRENIEVLNAAADRIETLERTSSAERQYGGTVPQPTDTARLDWLLQNHVADFECVENIAGNLERYHVPATREAIDLEISRATNQPTPVPTAADRRRQVGDATNVEVTVEDLWDLHLASLDQLALALGCRRPQ